MNDRTKQIIEDYKSGLKPAEIAVKNEVSRQYVYKLISGLNVDIVSTDEIIDNLKAQVHDLEEENARLKRIIDRLLIDK